MIKAGDCCAISWVVAGDAGTVKVYLDGTEIASAGPELHKTVAFDFNTGAVLSIRDEGANSVIQIWYFVVLKCGTGKFQKNFW